jgi:uncharacterized repeat protein (TIGR01451 family)
VTAGSELTYAIHVNNYGPEAAENVVLIDTLPDEVTFVSASAEQGSCNETNNVVTCSLGTMPNSTDTTVFIVVIVNPSSNGVITNTASVNTNAQDQNPANNKDSENTIVLSP